MWSSLLLSALVFAAPGELSFLESDSHCVAYRAEKTTLFITSGEVVGRNCEISAQVLPEVGGLYHIEVTIPIRGFKSGSSERDESVALALRVRDKAELVFRTKARSPEQWRELFQAGRFVIDGELQIGEKFYPLKLDSRYVKGTENDEIEGVAKVKFSDFQITPPKVAMGVIAKSKPEFELHFHLSGGRVLGADSIRLDKSQEKK